MAKADQRYRDVESIMKMPREKKRAFMEAGSEADRRHTARLKEIVSRHGWPTRALVGEEAAHAAFLLVQHADHDPAFQVHCLPMLEDAASRGEIPRSQLAFLTDRVRVKQGSPQLYGTQYAVATDESGGARVGRNGRPTYLLPVVEDIDKLDQRRRAAGLKPWAEYERRMAASQGREPAARPRTVQRDSW